jgi:hypothetical protein
MDTQDALPNKRPETAEIVAFPTAAEKGANAMVFTKKERDRRARLKALTDSGWATPPNVASAMNALLRTVKPLSEDERTLVWLELQNRWADLGRLDPDDAPPLA